MEVIKQWLSNKINHKEIGQYLLNTLEGRNLAIYGAGELGELLYDDLSDWPDFKVEYFIDKNADALYYGIDDMQILNLDELAHAKKVDAILITPYRSFRLITEELNRILTYHPKMLSLDDIVYRTE